MITSGATDSFRLEQSNGLHQPHHEYRLALYGDADLGPRARGYTTAGEVAGVGYSPGGLILSGRRVTLINDAAVTEWADAVWPDCTVDALGALLYNASLPSYPSVAVIAFDGRTSSTNGPFKVPLTRLIQWGR